MAVLCENGDELFNTYVNKESFDKMNKYQRVNKGPVS